MKTRYSIKLATRNIILNYKKSIAIIVGFTIAFTVCIMVFSYRNLLNNKLDETCTVYASANRIVFDGLQLNLELLEFIKTLDGVEEVQAFGYEEFEYLNEMDELGYATSYLEFKNAKLIIGGKNYICGPNHFSDELNGSDFFFLNSYTDDVKLFSNYEELEYYTRTGLDSFFCYGNAPKNIGEIVVPEDILELYQIPRQSWADFIGKEFTVVWRIPDEEFEYVKDFVPTDEVILFQGVLSGILKSEIYDINSRETKRCYVLTSEMPEYTSIYCYLEDYTHKDNIIDIMKEKYGIQGNTSSFFEVCEYISKQIKFVDSVFLFVAISILVALFINGFRIYYFYLNQKNGFFGMMKAVGYVPRDLCKIIISEVGIFILSSTVLSSVFGYIGITWFQEKMSRALGLELEWNITVYFQGVVLVISIALVFGLFLVQFIYRNIISRHARSLLIQAE